MYNVFVSVVYGLVCIYNMLICKYYVISLHKRFLHLYSELCHFFLFYLHAALTNVPISFMDSEVQSGATTKVLHEMLSRPDTKHAHLEFLLYKVPCAGAKHARNFDCSGVQFSVLCKKSMEKKLLERMFAYGMLISPEDVALAVDLLPDTTSPTLDLIASRCEGPPETSLSLAYVAAENSSKYQLLITLLKRRAQRPVPPKVYIYTLCILCI